MFCALDEIIDHLFFSCPLVRFVWSVMQCIFNSPMQPTTRKSSRRDVIYKTHLFSSLGQRNVSILGRFIRRST
jgi:hypothetical protein